MRHRQQLPQSRIKELRQQQGLSQRSLTKLLPMAHTTLSRYERGLVQPDGCTIVQIARALRVQPQEVDPDFNQKVMGELERIESDLKKIEELQAAIAQHQERVLQIQRSVTERQRLLMVCLAG